MPKLFSFGESLKKHIVVTGPESSGKTTLAHNLAEELNCSVVPEMARQYLNRLKRPYEINDLYKIAVWQMAWEDSLLPKKGRISDTDLLTLKIWSQEKFGTCDPRIENEFIIRKPHLYLLCVPDIPWEPDPQRENPNDRDRLFEMYKKELDHFRYPYIEVKGFGKNRLTNCLLQMKAFFSNL